ncbi:MAG: hypothetical protein K2M69_03430 [Muribaculaceae bacterium]|nr:hypothetical protein [Muribaculaceae bacterium]
MRYATIYFILFILLAMLSSCRSVTRYVPVEMVRTEYREADSSTLEQRAKALLEKLRMKRNISDSMIDRSRESVVLDMNGDTVKIEKTRYVYVSTKHEKELEREVAEQDSIIKDLRCRLSAERVDSIRVPYPVERELTKWEQTKMDFGGLAIVLLVVACVAVVWLIKRNKK